MNKQEKFRKTLIAARNALESVNIPFHLHSGSALGAIREGKFIAHDNDIDLGVFIWDYKKSLVSAMKKHGFKVDQHGVLAFGKEYTFVHKKTGVPVDVFLVYKDRLKKKGKAEDIYWVASFFGACDNKKYGLCRWKYRPYNPVPVSMRGILVNSAPISALEDGYGPRWNIPKKFDYFEGVDEGHYTNLIDE